MNRNPPANTARQKQHRSRVPHTLQADIERIWKRAYNARSREDLLDLYADWAEDYDAHHEHVGFVGHIQAAAILRKHIPDPMSVRVLDAGAGTGAAGAALSRLGFENLTAVDLSPEMLSVAERKGVYQHLMQADIGVPLDAFSASSFDAAILVGVFSYGQAPATTLDEMIRVVRPGGLIVFTMRTDFHESDAMGVRSRMDILSESGVWEQIERSEPAMYLPKKDPQALFRVWCFRVTDRKDPPLDPEFAEAIRTAMRDASPIKVFDHRFIWNARGSHLYESYIKRPEYYLNECEEEILRAYADEIVERETLVVELGCGSARKVRHVLDAVDRSPHVDQLTYVPIDLSPLALEATQDEVERSFPGRVRVFPRQGNFHEALTQIDDPRSKVIFFFGSSIGNIETLPATIEFLKLIRDCLSSTDRFVVGMDLDKEETVLRRAYEAGPENLRFFLNIVRRMNDEFGADFDLRAFRQDSSYDLVDIHDGIEDRCVNFKLVTNQTQKVHIAKLSLDVQLGADEAIQVGRSRKFRKSDIERLAGKAGLRLRRQWTDRRGYFSLNELVRDDTPPGENAV